jgi:hypothetical protein
MDQPLVSIVSPSTVVSEGVYQFLRGSIYGAIWGMVTPFYPPGSPGAAKEAVTGVFRAAPPFSSMSSIPSNAVLFGAILGVQRLSCKTLEMLRGKDDIWNDVFGFGVTYKYYQTFLAKTETRLLRHNRIVGATVFMTVVYANVFV